MSVIIAPTAGRASGASSTLRTRTAVSDDEASGEPAQVGSPERRAQFARAEGRFVMKNHVGVGES